LRARPGNEPTGPSGAGRFVGPRGYLVVRSQFFSFLPDFTSKVSSVLSLNLAGSDSSMSAGPPGPGPSTGLDFAPLVGLGTRISTLQLPTGTFVEYLPFSITAPAEGDLPSVGMNVMDDPSAGVCPSTVTVPVTSPVFGASHPAPAARATSSPASQ